MPLNQALAQLKAASQEALERIRSDREKAPHKIKPLLTHIENHLFNPDLRVGQLKRACDIRDNSISIQFRSALGQPPSTYIEECRLETASRLLRDTDLSISMVAELLGYSNLQVFSTAFHRWSGQRPSPYRKQFRRFSQPQQSFDESVLRVDHLRQALMGTLPSEEAQALLQRLQDVYDTRHPTDMARLPEIRPRISSLEDFITDEDRETAEVFFCEQLLGRPLLRQQQALRRQGTLPWLALFERLLKAAAPALEGERSQNCAEWTELALECLYLLELDHLFEHDRPLPSATLANLKARGWARLADARRRTFDFGGAEKAFEIAEHHLPIEGQSRRVLAEIHQFKSYMRWHQHRLGDALTLASRAIPLHRLVGEPGPLGHSLALRAMIHNASSKPRLAVPDLCEALQLLDIKSEPRAALNAHLNLVLAYLGSGYASEARHIMHLAQKLVEVVDDPLMSSSLHWLKGCLDFERSDFVAAEACWTASHDAFVRQGQLAPAALTALDLALLHLQIDKSRSAAQFAARALRHLQPLPLQEVALDARTDLWKVIESRRLEGETLFQIRGRLEILRRDLTLDLARPPL